MGGNREEREDLLPPDEVITVQANARDSAANETTERRIITPPLAGPAV